MVSSSIRFLSRKAKLEAPLQTDGIETPQAHFEVVDPETRTRPVPGAVSGGISGSTGTIGGWCWDTTDDTIVLVSKKHVLLSTIDADILQHIKGRMTKPLVFYVEAERERHGIEPVPEYIESTPSGMKRPVRLPIKIVVSHPASLER